MAKTVLHPADSRGHLDHGWLDTYHSFSFGSWHNPERVHFGELRVLNDDYVKGGFGFGKHPHDNMEIITVVLKGALEHQDSMGHTEAIHVNEVQVMSAGSGITHSEYNHNKDEDVNLIQIWIFPKERNVAPRYEQRVFDANERVNRLQMLVSPIDRNDDGLKIHQDAWIYRTQLEKGKSINMELSGSQHGVYAFVIEGSISLNGTQLEKRDAMGISDVTHIDLSANENADILLLEVPMYA
ncbi:MAG TPA: pirin family protein [Flavipsychrobacter sp.]|nr:pirin family protein [Flavipsychrobacter sp.]